MDEQQLIDLRRSLHRRPDLSGQESETARTIKAMVSAHGPDSLLTGIGGHGIAAVFCADEPGPTVLLRAELDGLPIQDELGSAHGSEIEGVSHKCGHDGHMTILVGLASRLGKSPPACGRVVLLFQPAEETGKGARRVLDDQVFQSIRPDWSFALHNLPGFALGTVVVRPGPFAAASRGIAVELIGETAHAAEPEAGRSPALAVASLIQAFSSLTQFHTALPQAAKATVTHASLGEEAFGTSPGYGRVLVTLRTHQTALADQLEERCRELAERIAHTYGLSAKVHLREPFPLTDNDPQAVALIEQAAADMGLVLDRPEHPFPWSEDFGHFTGAGAGALFGLGAGVQHPALHHSTYDFPDELLLGGLDLMECVARLALERFPAPPG